MKDRNGVVFGTKGLPLERIEAPIWASWQRDRLGSIWRHAIQNPWEYAKPVLPSVLR